MYNITKEEFNKLGGAEKRKLLTLLNRMGIKDMPKIKVKLLNEECMPVKKHRWDAGWDLKAAMGVTVKAGETVKVHTGTIFEISPRHMGMVVARSGLGCKHKVTLANDVGIIDSEYRGEVLVFLSNDSDKDLVLNQYDRFAQLIVVPINTDELWTVDKVSETGRGDGGFGSTGVESGRIDATKENISNIPKVDLSKQGKEIADRVDAMVMEEVKAGSKGAGLKLKTLVEHTPAEYMKLKNSGMMYEYYPEATGNMNEDLKLGK